MDELERREMIDVLDRQGYGQIVRKLLENDTTIVTSRGRINKSAIGRVLGINGPQTDNLIIKLRELLCDYCL